MTSKLVESGYKVVANFSSSQLQAAPDYRTGSPLLAGSLLAAHMEVFMMSCGGVIGAGPAVSHTEGQPGGCCQPTSPRALRSPGAHAAAWLHHQHCGRCLLRQLPWTPHWPCRYAASNDLDKFARYSNSITRVGCMTFALDLCKSSCSIPFEQIPCNMLKLPRVRTSAAAPEDMAMGHGASCWAHRDK